MKKFFFLVLVMFFLAVSIYAQEQYNTSGKEKINYRRTETIQLPTTNFK